MYKILFTSITITILFLVESIWLPWKPFFFVSAFLAVVIPFLTNSIKFGSLKSDIIHFWRYFLVFGCIEVCWELAVWTFLYNKILVFFGVQNNPFFSESAASERILTINYSLYGNDTILIGSLFSIFFVIWAPIGEELFYRGYIQGQLRKKLSFLKSVIIAALFVSIRHTYPYLILWPQVPWFVCGLEIVYIFIPAVYIGYLYEKTSSLWIIIFIHFIVNIISFPRYASLIFAD